MHHRIRLLMFVLILMVKCHKCGGTAVYEGFLHLSMVVLEVCNFFWKHVIIQSLVRGRQDLHCHSLTPYLHM